MESYQYSDVAVSSTYLALFGVTDDTFHLLTHGKFTVSVSTL